MKDYKLVWVGGHNGHWEIYDKENKFIISCDDNELNDELKKLN